MLLELKTIESGRSISLIIREIHPTKFDVYGKVQQGAIKIAAEFLVEYTTCLIRLESLKVANASVTNNIPVLLLRSVPWSTASTISTKSKMVLDLWVQGMVDNGKHYLLPSTNLVTTLLERRDRWL